MEMEIDCTLDFILEKSMVPAGVVENQNLRGRLLKCVTLTYLMGLISVFI